VEAAADPFTPSPLVQMIKFIIPMAIAWYVIPDPPKPEPHVPNPWLQGHSWPWLQKRWSAEELDPAGLTYRLPNFLSSEEVEHILTRVRPLANFSTESSTFEMAVLAGAGLAEPVHTGRHRAAKDYARNYSPLEVADTVLLGIERRVSELVGIPFHDFETPLQLSHTRPPSADAPTLEGSYIPSGNVHHDLNFRPNRTASLIMYLTSEGGEPWVEDGLFTEAQPLEGGATIFPCVRPWPSDVEAATPPPPPDEALVGACERFTSLFDRGMRFLLHPLADAAQSAQVTSAEPEAATLTSDLCVAASAPGSLRVRPRRGDALLFLSVHPETGEAFPQMWHAGCPVARGHKWTLQKFKETVQVQ